ncbi:MAG: DUF5666 domain-containing protein [Planctomycetota bacterium]
MLRTCSLGLVLTLFVLLAGCGGGGGGAGGSGTGSLDVFLSDAFTDDFEQVWLTLFELELRDSATQQFRTVYDDTGGVLFDARRLSDGAGTRFSFLGSVSVANGTYDRVRLTLKDEAVLVPAGSTVGQAKNLDNSLPRDALGRPLVEYGLVPPLDVSGPSGTLVIDFDLVSFFLDGNDDLIPTVRQGSAAGIDDSSRHEVEDYRGIVSGLTATSFTLRPATGATISVSLDPTTPVFSDSTGQNATLANGQLAEVRGVFSSLDRSLDAVSIKVEDSPTGSGEAEVRGTHGGVDLIANVLTLADIFMAQNFTPQGSTVDVVWSDTTVFRRSGDVVGESWLNSFPFSEVKGTYDAATNTITASRITLEDDDGRGPGEPEADGSHIGVDLTANTMTLTSLTRVQGFTPTGAAVAVTWTVTTVFRRGGDIVDETWLNDFPLSQVKGTYDAATNTLTATRITLEDEIAPPLGQNEAEAAGSVGALDLAGNTLTLSSLSAVAGFTPPGATVNVAWDAQTVFRFKGNVVDESFLTSHPRAEVRGTYDAATNTITADRISPKE